MPAAEHFLPSHQDQRKLVPGSWAGVCGQEAARQSWRRSSIGRFNAWGGKYPPYDDDDAVPTRIAEELRLPVFYPGIVMEGGAVDFNGAGTVLTTTDLPAEQEPQSRTVAKRRSSDI